MRTARDYEEHAREALKAAAAASTVEMADGLRAIADFWRGQASRVAASAPSVSALAGRSASPAARARS